MPARRRSHCPSPQPPAAASPHRPAADQVFQDLFDAYENVLFSIRGYGGKPAEATELERAALMNRLRKRLAVNAKMPPGYNGALTARETAHQLGVCVKHVHYLCREGRLNPVKVDGRLYILPEEVRAYRHEQEVWAARGGRWTPYGREERKEPESAYKPVDDAVTRRHGGAEMPDSPHPEPPESQWVTAREAQEILDLSHTTIGDLARSGKLICRYAPNPSGHRGLFIRLDSALAYAAWRESRAWKRGISPAQWAHDLRHPIIRTKIEPPPGDALLTRREAAEFLGVTVEVVTALVKRGRLFGWQERPGLPGSRLYLSANQLNRYANDPMRLKRRAAALEGHAPPELKTGYDREAWLESTGLIRYAGCHDRRERGEFLSTAQAAELLGIRPLCMLQLRARGRLRGYQRNPGKRGWWFFRRDDVEDLLADRDYAKRRRASQKALATLRARRNEPPAIIYCHDDDES